MKRPTVSRRAVMTSMVLSIVFVLAVTMRAYAAKYGFYLNEFDPYYDYFAASHIVTLAQQHGLFYALFNNPPGCGPTVMTACHNLQGYFQWHDITTWFPEGRDVAATSQDGLQIGGAILYLLVHDIFGVQISLYDFLVLLPVFLGAITSVLFYFLVRRIGGDAAGLFAALIFAVSPPLIERGNLGWFKSEPLAILCFVCASYVMLTVFDKERTMRSRILRALLAGAFAGYANLSWGGGDYFTAAFGLLFILIPFMNLDLSNLSPAIISFAASTIFVSALCPRPGIEIVTNPVGLVLLGGTIFVLIAQWAKTWTKPADYRQTLIKLLFGFALAGLAFISFGSIGSISGRYLAVIDPFIRSSSALTQSVAEEQLPTGADYFTSYALLLSFGMAGALIAFRRKGVPMAYALIFGLTAIYFSAAFSRLLVYSSIALGILGGIGFAELAFALVKPGATTLVKKKQTVTTRNEMKVVFTVAIIGLMVFPAGAFWIPNPIACTTGNTLFCDQSPADNAVSIVNGATIYGRSSFSDWPQTLSWVSQSTPPGSVIISWWDYGYWFAVMGNRTTVADNGTLNSTRIAEIGQMFMSNATTAAKMAKDMGGDRPTYVAIFITGSILSLESTSGTYTNYYILDVPSGSGYTPGGGDESKKEWFIRIGGLNESQYLECPSSTSLTSAGAACESEDDFNLTPYALQNTTFANMFPFKFAGYLVETNSTSYSVSYTYKFMYTGYPPIELFSSPLSYTFPSNSTEPFRLAYASPSINDPYACPGNSQVECFSAILIYQVV
jgi:dolichyl-diphosphooligosaccharide--protein glycosyltransferase